MEQIDLKVPPNYLNFISLLKRDFICDVLRRTIIESNFVKFSALYADHVLSND